MDASLMGAPRRRGIAGDAAQVEEVLLRRRAFGQLDADPLALELNRVHEALHPNSIVQSFLKS
jgi:hypothetical protein